MSMDIKNAALLIIDMQNGFIEEASSFCIAGAKATVPACIRVAQHARSIGIPVIYVRRNYSADGSNVEAVRRDAWEAGGKPISDVATLAGSKDFPSGLEPASGDLVIEKPRFSAFFDTALDAELHKRGIDTVIVTGTTTPNCIRTTCYDALSLDYHVVVVEDCTSSRTPEVQAANIEDLAFIGAQVISSTDFCRL